MEKQIFLILLLFFLDRGSVSLFVLVVGSSDSGAWSADSEAWSVDTVGGSSNSEAWSWDSEAWSVVSETFRGCSFVSDISSLGLVFFSGKAAMSLGCSCFSVAFEALV